MSADYDLVVLGGTLEGRFAASLAAGYGARVALIEPPTIFFQRQQVRYLLKGLQQLAKGRERQAVDAWFRPSVDLFKSIDSRSMGQKSEALDWPALLKWSELAVDTQLLHLSPEALSSRGVDFISAMPESLYPHSRSLAHRLVVISGNRTLSTRAVLAAFGTVPRTMPRVKNAAEISMNLGIPSVTGIESLLVSDRLPKKISIWGDSFEAVDWAEALNAHGSKVTLVADRFLRDEDSEIREVVRSQLISAGINIISSTQRRSPKPSPEVILQLGRHKPALVLPDFVYQPAQNYQGIDARIPERPYLLSNNRLQTSHPRVFACGSLLRRRNFPFSIAKHEAQIAVSNALFLPTRRTYYKRIVRAYARFAKVGKTPKFAKEGRAPIVRGYQSLSASDSNSADLSCECPRLSYCKIICKHNRVQSIHLLATDAEGVISTFAPMVGHPITELLSAVEAVTGPVIVESSADLVRCAAREGMPDRWQPTHWRRDLAENWFNWRRSR